MQEERDYLIRPGEMENILEMRAGMTFQTAEAEKYFFNRRNDFYAAYYGYTGNRNTSRKFEQSEKSFKNDILVTFLVEKLLIETQFKIFF